MIPGIFAAQVAMPPPGPGPAPEFPEGIAGLILHLDASSISGLTDGTPVAAWQDIGPNGHSPSQGTASRQPLYRVDGIGGRPAVEFDGSDDSMSTAFGATYSQPNTVFAVVRFLSLPSSDASPWMDGSSSSNRHWMGSSNSNTFSIWAGDPFANSVVAKNTDPNIVMGVYDRLSSRIAVAGHNNAVTTGNQGWAGVTLGSRWDNARNVNVLLSEVIAYNRALSEEEQDRLYAYLSAKYDIYQYITYFGSLGSGGKWAYGVMADNGLIYGTPFQTSSILKLDPVDRTVTSIPGPGSGNNQWIGLIKVPDGRLFGVPARNSDVLVIDPSDDSVFTFAAADYNEYYGGALADNGKIYCCPFSRPSVLVIDPATNTSSTIGPVNVETSGVEGQWGWFIKDPVSGKLYAAPRNEPSILVVDPATDAISYITAGVPTGLRKYTGGLIAPSGEIWLIPRAAETFCVINPATDTARTVGVLPAGFDKWNGGTVIGDWVVMFPRSHDQIVAVNSVTEEIRFFDAGGTGANKWVGSVDVGGESFLIPYFSSSVGVVAHSDLGL